MTDDRPYNHPYTPYPIQIQLMNAIYDTIDSGCKIGLFESPTGTGKTLSLICSTMLWLRDYKRSENNLPKINSNGSNDRQHLPMEVSPHSKSSLANSKSNSNIETKNISKTENLVTLNDEVSKNTPNSASKIGSAFFSDSDSDDEPEWIRRATQTAKKEHDSRAIELETHLSKVETDWDLHKHTTHATEGFKRRKLKPVPSSYKSNGHSSGPSSTSSTLSDAPYIPEDYYSDSEVTSIDPESDISKQVRALLARVDPHTSSTPTFTNDCPHRIYFSSRTHSQLSQFAHQLQLTSFPSSLSKISERTKFVPLASRKQLCIHPEVSAMKDATSINDRCLDMQKSGKDKLARCSFFPGHIANNDPSTSDRLEEPKEALARKLSDLTLAKVHDIEDLAEFGKTLEVCPYYSVRSAVELSEIVALPYQMLLLDTTRQALRLLVDNAIVVIDEAHNLLDAITSIHSVSLSYTDLLMAESSLKKYLQRFSRRLNTGNRVNLMKLIRLCRVLASFIETNSKNGQVKPGKEVESDDIFGNSAQINIHKLEQFLQKTKIAYKIESYMEDISEAEGVNKKGITEGDKRSSKRESSSSTPILFKITAFLRCCSNPSKEGRFYWEKKDNKVLLNYTLLDPSEVFRDVVERAKCVILCGGTMEPMSDYTDFLFPYITQDQIRLFSCGHIVPDENLEVFPIGFRSSVSNSIEFEFLFDKRNSPTMINDLGLAVLDIVKKTPAGMVVFLPSYKYLDQVLEEWKLSGTYDCILALKNIFMEPSSGTLVESTLSAYSMAAKESGAILFSVVGGKMSEGINFADDLARAVVMIGLPFPNAFSGELVAKRKFIESSVIEKGGSALEASEKARNFYENICMRAVNQSVGRSIRHIGDYSTIYLIDKRYGTSRIQEKLSGWVKKRLCVKNDTVTLEEALRKADKFFTSKSK